jgi:sirohydrochlorin ferrochelatase
VREARDRQRGALAAGREDDPHRLGMQLAHAGEHRDAVDARHAEVGDDDVEALLGDELERSLATEREADVPTGRAALERFSEAAEDARVVVDEEDAQRTGARGTRVRRENGRERAAHTRRVIGRGVARLRLGGRIGGP